MKTKKYLLKMLIGIFMLISLTAKTQSNVYWFAPPAVIAYNYLNDRPIYICVSTYKETNVLIEQPANSNFTPIQVTVPEKTVQKIDLTAFINEIEAKPDEITNTGLKITVDTDATVTYLVNSDNSPESFALKGEKALGTEFYTPFQTFAYNMEFYSKTNEARSGFDIVATEDGTIVEITPSAAMQDRDVEGGIYEAGVTYTVELDKGQVYSTISESHRGQDHPAGSHVVANKPIALTIVEDVLSSRILWGVGTDLSGEQAYPVSQLGSEYIVIQGDMQGDLDYILEKVYVLAVEDGTEVSINGVATTSLNAGEQYEYDLLDPSVYISSSKPVTVLHLSGSQTGLSETIMVPLDEIPSYNSYVFTTTEDDYNFMLILTKAGNEGNFELNGDKSYVQASDFSVVPGTNGEYVSAKVVVNDANLTPNQINFLQSKEPFTLYTLVSDRSVSVSDVYYTYAVGGNLPFIEPLDVDIIVDSEISCETNDGALTANATGGVVPYTFAWSNGDTTASITGLVGGTYFVTVTDSEGNADSTEATLTGVESFEITLFSPTIVGDYNTSCAPEGDGSIELTIEGSSSYTIVWSTGATNVETLDNLTAGTYSVTVTDEYGCSEEAEITLTKPENCGCIIDQPAAPVSCSDCQVELSRNKSIVYDGEVACLTSKFNGWNIDVRGGTVIVCDNVTMNYNITLENDAQLIILKDASLSLQHLNLNANAKTAVVKNYGTMHVQYNFSYTGLVENYGNLIVDGYLNCNSANGYLLNSNFMQTGYINIDFSTIENNGVLINDKDCYINSQASFINRCDFTNGNTLIIDSRINFSNFGKIDNGGMFRWNSTAGHFAGGSVVLTKDLFGNDTKVYNEGSSCALIVIKNSTKFNQGYFDGEISICDLDGTIEQPGNVKLVNGATFSCSECTYDPSMYTLKSSDVSGAIDNKSYEITVYPSPAVSDSYIYVTSESNDDFTVNISKIKGQIIQSVQANGTASLSTKGLETGVYILQTIYSDGTVKEAKIVIE